MAPGQVEETRVEVDTLKARIETEQDDLKDQLERLTAQLGVKAAELKVADAGRQRASRAAAQTRSLHERNVVGQSEVEQLNDAELLRVAQCEVKKAEIGEVEVLIRQVKRRLDRIDRLAKEFLEPAPAPAR
jgi:hypothetical protein